MKVIVEIDDITEPQKIALEDMFATMVMLGNIGSSRWVCFYSDGDGNYRPKILINGEKPKLTDLLIKEERWNGGEYRIDFDLVSHRLRRDKENL